MDRKIEALVATTFDVEPSPDVAAEVLGELGTQRRPRRLFDLVTIPALAAAILAGVVFAAVDGDAPRLAEDGVRLPVVEEPALAVRIRKDRTVEVPHEDGWKSVTLDGFAAYLRKHDPKSRVVIHADRATPWRHVQWLMTICAQEKFPKVEFAARSKGGAVVTEKAHLPTDLGLPGAPKTRLEPFLLLTKEARIGYGRTKIENGERTEASWKGATWEVVRPWLAAEAKTTGRVVLRATATVAQERILEALRECSAAGFPQVLFHGTQIPSPEERRAERLPPVK